MNHFQHMPRFPRAMGRRITSRRCGLTLIEVLVSITIIAIMIAIAMPAIETAREASRRTQCVANVSQLGLAIQNYAASYSVLPIDVSPFAHEARKPIQQNGKGWIVGILPYIEQQQLYEQFVPHFKGHFFDGDGLRSSGCLPAMQTQLSLLTCPSVGTTDLSSETQYQWEGTRVAVTCYKGVLGDSRIGGRMSIHFNGTMPDCHNRGGCNGLFYRGTFQEPRRYRDIRDGTSNTMMLGEDVPEHNDHSAAFYANGGWASCHAPLNYFPDPPRPRDWWDVISFRSYHPGGAQFCFADGSVRFINDKIEHELYRALSTRAGREVVEVP